MRASRSPLVFGLSRSSTEGQRAAIRLAESIGATVDTTASLCHALLLVRDLNAFTRFHARRMRIPGDVTGADSVLCWQTGFPFSVSLNRGYPRYNPDEYSADEMLQRDEVDLCVLVGSEAVTQMSIFAQSCLRRIPTIVLDHPIVDSAVTPTVRFTTAVYGIHLSGTAYRMDEIPIPLRPLLPPKYASDAEILNRLCDEVGPNIAVEFNGHQTRPSFNRDPKEPL